MKAARRVRAALLRLAPPWRRRHPVMLGGTSVSQASSMRYQLRTRYRDGQWDGVTVTAGYYRAEHDPDPAQEGGA